MEHLVVAAWLVWAAIGLVWLIGEARRLVARIWWNVRFSGPETGSRGLEDPDLEAL